MSDLTGKQVKTREAEATGFIHLKPETISLIKETRWRKVKSLHLQKYRAYRLQNDQSTGTLVHNVALSQIETKAIYTERY